MSVTSRLRNRFLVARGRANVRVGRLTRDRRRQARGHGQHLSGMTRQFGERLRDAGEGLLGAFRR
jgi:uncharacterized protein YjbJ (UPF0337 family)